MFKSYTVLPLLMISSVRKHFTCSSRPARLACYSVCIAVVIVNLLALAVQLRVWPAEAYFHPNMAPAEKKILMDTFKEFIRVMDLNNLTYLAYGGTLLGSYRHHGFIPWDDDLDVLLNASDIHKVMKALKSMAPAYHVQVDGDDPTKPEKLWKLYKSSLPDMLFRPFKWPFIDIFFFGENATHLWTEVPKWRSKYTHQKNKVFPLTKRPFEDVFVNAPCDTVSVLNSTYNIDICALAKYSHKRELPSFNFRAFGVPCSGLYHMYPFVRRTSFNGSLATENLEIGHYKLQSLVLTQNACQTTD